MLFFSIYPNLPLKRCWRSLVLQTTQRQSTEQSWGATGEKYVLQVYVLSGNSQERLAFPGCSKSSQFTSRQRRGMGWTCSAQGAPVSLQQQELHRHPIHLYSTLHKTILPWGANGAQTTPKFFFSWKKPPLPNHSAPSKATAGFVGLITDLSTPSPDCLFL